MKIHQHHSLQASSYRQDYGSSVPISQLTQRVSSYMHAYTLYSSVRPFGITAMLGCWTQEKVRIFTIASHILLQIHLSILIN